MKLLSINLLLVLTLLNSVQAEVIAAKLSPPPDGTSIVMGPFKDWSSMVTHPALAVKRSDLITYEHMMQIYKVAEKGYASNYILDKGLKETGKSPHLAVFNEWLTDLKRYPTLPLSELISACTSLRDRLVSTSGIARLLLTQRLNSCRQIVLQQLTPKLLADKIILPDEYEFFNKFMQPLVHGRSQSDFIWFMQRLEKDSVPKAEISRLITEYVIKNNAQVPRELLATMVISPELTAHIQNFGLDTDATRQVFQNEFSRWIEDAYTAIDKKPRDAVERHVRGLGAWLKANSANLNLDAALGRYADLGKNLWRNDHPELAREIFDQVMREGNKEQRDDAWFFRLWMWVAKKEWKEALQWAESQRIPSRFAEINDSRLKFWIAEVYQQQKKSNEARAMFEQVILSHPLSFYAIMASKSLQANYPGSGLISFYANAVKPDSPTVGFHQFDAEFIESVRRLRAWSRLDYKEFMNAEVRGLRRTTIPLNVARVSVEERERVESDMFYLMSAVIGDEKNFIESFRAAYQSLEKRNILFRRSLLEVLYPRPYFEHLLKTMKNHPADPLLVLSLIRQESVFNPEARSRVGARGLMQLMPLTARRLKRSVREHHLTIPLTNMEIGTRYVEQLFKRYDGNLVHVLAAYNAGEARVEKWKNLYFNSDEMLTNIESIPFLETRNYVKLIFRNLFFYKMLDGKKDVIDGAARNKIHDVSLGFTH